MKKVFLSLVMASAVVLASAQISQTPIQSFNDNIWNEFVFEYSNGEEVIIRYEYYNDGGLVNIYDLSFNLKKSINLSAIQGIYDYGITELYISEGRDQTSDLGLLVTEKIFNNDELLEIIVLTTDGFVIVNENGVEIFRKRYTPQAGYQLSWVSHSLLETRNGNLLAVNVSFYNDGNYQGYYTTEYYALPGYTTPSGTHSAAIRRIGNPFPNPAKTYIQLPCELPYGVNTGTIHVFNAQGRLIKTFRVNDREKFVRLDTTDLPSGNYYFSLEIRGQQAESKPFIVAK